ncbi:MAG: nucleotidyltransferase domain-containing protein [Candidatus Eisenbacteria bacterium]
MRHPSFASLFPRAQRRVLDLVFLQPDQAWYRSQLARTLGVPASSLQRPLAGLVSAGVLLTVADGNRLYYRVNRESPIYVELHSLLVKTSGVIGVLREALEPHASRIDAAFVYGSFARGDESASSDVDLFIVGSLRLAEVTPALRAAAARLSREVNATVHTPAELASKARARKHFIIRTLDGPKLFVLGTKDDLARLAGAETGSAGGDQQG